MVLPNTLRLVAVVGGMGRRGSEAAIELPKTRSVDMKLEEVFHRAVGEGALSGPDPATFSDPDGNGWLLQEGHRAIARRVDSHATTFTSSRELAIALRRVAASHGEHEKRNGKHGTVGWPDWYAEHIVAEEAGNQLPL